MNALALVLMAALAAGEAAPVEALKHASVTELIARGKAALAALGDYKVRSRVEERVGGELQAPHVLQMWVREAPYAVRVENLTGGAQGRKVFYDSQARPGDLRVRESGFLGIAGPLWIGLHNGMLFRETNHPITDVGIGAVIRLQDSDVEKARAFGGYVRTDEGLNERGRYCIRYDAPPGSSGLYAQRSVICLDPETALPLEITAWDQKGLLERFVFQTLEPHAAEGEGVFTLKAAGL